MLFFFYYYLTAFTEKCNKKFECTDASDEDDCSCQPDEFMCQCSKKVPSTCFGQDRCIPINKYLDGVPDCPEGSDETQYVKETECGQCNVTIYRLPSKSACEELSSLCDSSSCYRVPSLRCEIGDCSDSEVICTSFCSNHDNLTCNRGFQCADGSLALAHQFCDGKFDCPDNSDELTSQPGHECVEPGRNCILPQRNLYDNVPHCSDKSDLCMNQSSPCFQCLDKRLTISSSQVCNGVVDCHDASDECLCDESNDSPACQSILFEDDSSSMCGNLAGKRNKEQLLAFASIQHPLFAGASETSQIACKSKWGNVLATLCDGRPECNDFRDECNCEVKPDFCNDTCHSFYRLGDRYCDGIEDEAWNFINDPACPKGFDETSCPKRFNCNAKTRNSIDVGQICDGIIDCDDGSDEFNCSNPIFTSIFSSQNEMIENAAIRYIYWILAMSAICGNVYMLITITLWLRKEKLRETIRCQLFIALNISIADFFMGIYLIVIAAQSLRYSGYYESVDYQWRTSSECAFIGSLAFISVEASCFLMLLLTIFLLYSVCKSPVKATSNLIWKICAGLAWIEAILLATAPFFGKLSRYFVHDVWLSVPVSDRKIWNREELEMLTCRLAKVSKTRYISEEWESSVDFLTTNFPNFAPQGEFGYYSATSICMPEFYVPVGGNSWEYSLTIITINFTCFLLVGVNYFIACKISSRRHENSNDIQAAKQESQLQRRIARIIFTNSVCWISIGVIAYLKIGGIALTDLTYVVSAFFLLPINSALNPFLFSSLPEKIAKILSCKKIEEVQLF